jgi:hypothetical protein
MVKLFSNSHELEKKIVEQNRFFKFVQIRTVLFEYFSNSLA